MFLSRLETINLLFPKLSPSSLIGLSILLRSLGGDLDFEYQNFHCNSYILVISTSTSGISEVSVSAVASSVSEVILRAAKEIFTAALP